MKKLFVLAALGLFLLTANKTNAQCAAEHQNEPALELTIADNVDLADEDTPAALLVTLTNADVESAEYQVALQYYHSHPDRITAGILAILLGDFGVQHFYTGQITRGILDICFCWTGIPALIGLIEGIVWLCESDAAFYDQVCCRH